MFFCFVFYLFFYTKNPPTQNFVHALMWRLLSIVPLINNVPKVTSFNPPYWTSLLKIQRVCLCHHVLFLCLNVCVVCIVVWKTGWTIGCNFDLWMILVLILKQGELSSVLQSHCLSSLWHVRWVGLVLARPENWLNLANLSVLSGSSSSRLLFLGLRGVEQRALGLRPAHLLCNFADSSCYAVQFSQHF